jgi:hypothetical protein
VNQDFQIESSYDASPGNFQRDYKTHTFNGTYTAAEIMTKIGEVTTAFMQTISATKGYTIVKEEAVCNLDSFFIDLSLDKTTDLSFMIDLTSSTDIIDILRLPTIFQTLDRGTQSHITFGPNKSNGTVRPNTKLMVGSGGGSYQDINDGGSALLLVSNGNFHIDSVPGHSMYLNYFSGGSILGSGGSYYHSDDRLKSQEKYIENAVETLSKLRPQTYMKRLRLDGDSTSERFQAGLIAQEIYYDCPELKHLVFIAPGATPSETKEISDDPTVDPDYSDWGDEPSAVNYTELIPYLIKAVQELKADIELLKAK